MERLVQNIMKQYGICGKTLMEKQEIPTPMGEMLYWDYYRYARDNPISKWNAPTAILYGSKYNFTKREVIKGFTKRYGSVLTILHGCDHRFQTKRQFAALDKWFDSNILKAKRSRTSHRRPLFTVRSSRKTA